MRVSDRAEYHLTEAAEAFKGLLRTMAKDIAQSQGRTYVNLADVIAAEAFFHSTHSSTEPPPTESNQ